jgi:hypothetical protein
MAKTPANGGQSWKPAEVKQLRQELKENTPTRVMSLKHRRSPGAVQQKANSLGLSTKPTNQSPYGTKGKKR